MGTIPTSSIAVRAAKAKHEKADALAWKVLKLVKETYLQRATGSTVYGITNI